MGGPLTSWPRNRHERREAARRRAEDLRPQGRPDRLATPTRRVMAALVDSAVTAACAWLAIVGMWLGGAALTSDRTLAVNVIGGAVIGHVYVLVATALWGQTLGKRLLGIRVVRSDTFDLPGWKRAGIRTLGLVPLGMLPYGAALTTVGEGSFLFTRTRQGVHDVFAGTIVVDDREWHRWRAHSARPRRPRTGRTK
jgi:uncharacterized RDD family membrane protein YckC